MFKKFLSCFLGSLVATASIIPYAKADDFPPSRARISRAIGAPQLMSETQKQRSIERRKSLLQIAYEYGDSLFEPSKYEHENFEVKFPIIDVIAELYGPVPDEIDDKILSDISNNFLGGAKITLCPAEQCSMPGITLFGGQLYSIHFNLRSLQTSEVLVYDSETNRKIAILLLMIYLHRDPTGFSEDLKTSLEQFKALKILEIIF